MVFEMAPEMNQQVLPGLTHGNSFGNTGNPLYPYCQNPASYHCPGDVRYKLRPGAGWAYDSYSKTQNVGGESANNYDGAGIVGGLKGTYTAHARAMRCTFHPLREGLSEKP